MHSASLCGVWVQGSPSWLSQDDGALENPASLPRLHPPPQHHQYSRPLSRRHPSALGARMEHIARNGVLNLHLGIDMLFPKETRGLATPRQEEDSSQSLGERQGPALSLQSTRKG